MSLDFLAGCVGGATGVVVGHPLDTVKVRLQIQSSENAKYRGTFHCLSTIVKNENFSGLYKGISSPLVGVAGVNALIFGVYGSLRPYVHGQPGNDALWAHFVAGSISGGVQSFIASPMELIKTRMQLNEGTGGGVATKAPSFVQVAKSIYQKEGGFRKGIYKGFGVTVAREIPGFGFYFATYEALTTKSGREVGTIGMMMAGGMAGVVSWLVTFPTDVVKTRLQTDVTGKYTGAVDCIKKTYQMEGPKAFWRGLGSTLIRAFPTNAATFTVVTWIMRWYESNQVDSVSEGAEYIKDLLKETASLHFPIPHYLTAPLCSSLVSTYSTTPYFNLYATINSLCIEGASEEYGIIRQRFAEAFKNENKEQAHHNKVVQNSTQTKLHILDSISTSPALEEEEEEEISCTEEENVLEEKSSGSGLFLNLFKRLLGSTLEENRFLSSIS